MAATYGNKKPSLRVKSYQEAWHESSYFGQSLSSIQGPSYSNLYTLFVLYTYVVLLPCLPKRFAHAVPRD
jgi:hypothetical protein